MIIAFNRIAILVIVYMWFVVAGPVQIYQVYGRMPPTPETNTSDPAQTEKHRMDIRRCRFNMADPLSAPPLLPLLSPLPSPFDIIVLSSIVVIVWASPSASLSYPPPATYHHHLQCRLFRAIIFIAVIGWIAYDFESILRCVCGSCFWVVC